MKVKRYFSIIGALVLGLVPALAREGDNKQAVEKDWAKALASDDFATRESATAELWAMGRQAEPILEDLVKVKDPEVENRARLVLRKVRLGVTPDTPAEVEDLLRAYLSGSPNERMAVLAKLLKIGATDYIVKLRLGESDPRTIRRFDDFLEENMAAMVNPLIKEEKFAEARKILELSDRFVDLIRLGHLLDLEGGLDDELARLKSAEEKEDQKRYLAYLRVKGDAALLRKEAARLGDRDAEVLAALAEGDFEPYFQDLLDGPGQEIRGISDYIRWALAEAVGDRPLAREIYESLSKAASGPKFDRAALMNLCRMGYADEVLAGLTEEQFQLRLSLHLSREDYPQVEELLELPDEGAFAAWLEKWVGKAKGPNLEEKTFALDLISSATGFLEGRGRIENAVACAEATFDLIRERETDLRERIAWSWYYSAPKALLSAFAREIKDFERNPSGLLGLLPRGGDEYIWLYELLVEEDPDLSVRDRLLLTLSFSYRHPLVEAQRYEGYFDRILQQLLKSNDPKESLKRFFGVIEQRNRGDEMRRVLEALDDGELMTRFQLAQLATDEGRFEQAAGIFQKLLEEGKVNSPEFRYATGLLREKAGDGEGKEQMAEALRLGDGDASFFETLSVYHLQMNEPEKSFELQQKAFLRLEAVAKPGERVPSSRLVKNLAADAALLRRWKIAVGFRQVSALLESTGYSLAGGHYVSRFRFGILVARGALAMERGDVETAVASFGEAHRILPHDGYLANELFPVMREVGLSEYHDQLFAESARFAREMVRRYPKDDNIYNNFAWLASRANRCLDEAEEYLKIGLEMNPQSAAYLDTMGEIHFARRNRAEAVKWSNRSLANETLGEEIRWELHQQNQRFKSGPFPPK